MINFDSLLLKALIKEIKPILTGGRIRKIRQPSKHEILLAIRSAGQNYNLYVCVDPKYPHVCLLSPEGEALRNFEIPQKPPMFCMLLRKHMEGRKINSAEQPGFERILEIKFAGRSELGEEMPMTLSCEFMGKYGNIVLYNDETNIIKGCAHSVGSEKSRVRELAGGLPYIYPPKQNKYDLNQISEEEFVGFIKSSDISINMNLNKNFGFISKALAGELCDFTGINPTENSNFIPHEKISELYSLLKETVSLNNINLSISGDKKLYSLISLDNLQSRQCFDSVNLMTDMYFGHHVNEDLFSRLKSYISKIVDKELKKQKKRLEEGLNPDNFNEKRDKYRKYADIIMANLYNIKKGTESAELENLFDENKIINIPLDKKLSAEANAGKYYKLYTKAKNAARYARESAEKIQTEINYPESIKESINYAVLLSDLKQIELELISQELIKPGKRQIQKKGNPEKPELTEFISSDGFKILLGKNNKQNDFLLKIASPEDIWLHARDIPGSHVLVKVPKNIGEIAETTLYQAACIAAYYSRARESLNIPVIRTKKKFVKKPSGAKPGFVTYTHEKTLFVNPEKEKLPSLKIPD